MGNNSGEASTEPEELEGNEAGVDNIENDGQQGQEQAANGNDGSSNTGRTFTQDEVNRMMAREKKQGRNAAYNDLGIDPNDSKAMALIKAVLQSQKQDTDGESAAANEAAVAEANHRAVVAEAKAQAMMLGIAPKFVDDAVALAMPKISEGEDAKSVLSELKSKYPIWKDASKNDEGEPGSTGQKGTGSSVGNRSGGAKPDASKGIGARLAASRKASKPKSSYWKNS